MICAVQPRYPNPILGHTPQRLPTSRLRRAASSNFGNMFRPLDLLASSTESHVCIRRFSMPGLRHTRGRWSIAKSGVRKDHRDVLQPAFLLGAGHVRLSVHHKSSLQPRPRPGFRDRPAAACGVLTDQSDDDMRRSETTETARRPRVGLFSPPISLHLWWLAEIKRRRQVRHRDFNLHFRWIDYAALDPVGHRPRPEDDDDDQNDLQSHPRNCAPIDLGCLIIPSP